MSPSHIARTPVVSLTPSLTARAFSALGLFAIVGFIVTSQGCGGGSSGYKAGAKTSESVMASAKELDEGSAQTDKVVTSLNKLTGASAKTNLRPLLKEYSSSVDKLDSIAKHVKKQADDMRAQGQAYFKKWDADVAKINNEDIKKRSAQRRTEVEQAFQRLNDKTQTLKNAYQPMMSDLQDIRTALNSDLTAGGIASIRPIADRVAREATAVKNAASAVAAEYQALGVKMSPTGK